MIELTSAPCTVSIITINYNTAALTSACISSVIEKTKRVSYEMIVVDNASTETLPEDFVRQFPSVKLIKSQINLGFAGGNNLGIQHATGEYILLLNSDTVLINDAVSETINAMKLNTVLVAGCKVYNDDGSIQSTCAFFPGVRMSLLALLGITQISRKFGFKTTSYQYDYQVSHEVDWLWGCFLLFHRKALNHFSNHLLPADFFMYAEDLLWGYKWKSAGIQSWYFPKGEITHLFSGVKTNPDPLKNKGIQNGVIFLKRNYSWIRARAILIIDFFIRVTRFRWRHILNLAKVYVKMK